ncbi:hypothetical protein A7U43_28615 (plasmid) [Mycobacterium adipatum]|uniref:Uncharacterized protein n=1 Tax=Mycobacterium adipatum TaxID=1682113 RepID=A0A172UWR5_9MYCO|nr:hypothetical protein A7U43_28615 [Mycobacterium adipatum]
MLNVRVDLPVDIDALESQWRLRAYASEVRAVGVGVITLQLMVIAALFGGVVSALKGSYVAAAIAALIAIACYLVARRAKPVLMVGPDAAGPPPFWFPGGSQPKRCHRSVLN